VMRNSDTQLDMVLIRVHDFCVILQFLSLIPLVFAFYKLIQRQSPNTSQAVLYVGIGSLGFTALFLSLNFPKIVADVLYMFPQGVFGVWLMNACWRLKGLTALWLRAFGVVVGLGLALVGLFPLGYAIFVNIIILHIPAASNEVIGKIPLDTPANVFLHQILWVGSFMGVLTLPIWTILTGARLLRKNMFNYLNTLKQ